MNEDYSNKKLQSASFEGKKLVSARFVNTDLRGADFSGADLAGADFTNAKTGITPLNKVWLFMAALVVSALSGYIAMLAGRTVQTMLLSADEGVVIAGYVSIIVIIFFILFSYWVGVGTSIFSLLIPVTVLALIIGSIANFSGHGSGLGAIYLTVSLILVSVMFIVGTVARVSAGALSNILFVIVAVFGASFGRSVGGGLGTVVLAISCALISKKVLAGDPGFESLRRIAHFFTRKFGTSFRNANLKSANFSGATIANADFSNADISSVNWGDSEKINCITTDQKQDSRWTQTRKKV